MADRTSKHVEVASFVKGTAAHPLEQRSSPRVATWIAADVKLSGEGWIGCHLRDVGTGGACIQTDSPVAVSELRWLEIKLPDGKLKVQVTGCWQREAGPEQAILTGLEFRDLEPGDRKRIEGFVHERLLGLVRFLESSEDLGGLSLDEAMDVALVSRLRSASLGRYVHYAGADDAQDDSVLIVLEGVVGLEIELRGVRVPVGQVDRGGVLGGIDLVATVDPCVSAVANRDLKLLEIDRNAFGYLRRAKPLVAERIASIVVQHHIHRLHGCIERLVQDR